MRCVLVKFSCLGFQIQYSASSFNGHFRGLKGEIGVGDKRLRILIDELTEEGRLVYVEPKDAAKNIIKVLAIPATASEYRKASDRA